MSLMNLATVFGPSLLRSPVVGLGYNGPSVDITQEVVVQVGMKQRKVAAGYFEEIAVWFCNSSTHFLHK